MAEPAHEEIQTYQNYDVAFDGYSLGTEEELYGPAMAVAADAPKLVAVVRDTGTGKVLVEVTKDLPIGRTKTYTIELRTTPTELANQDGWRRRRKALVHAITAVDRQTLAGEDWDFCHLEILNPNYTITPPLDKKDVNQTGRQATIGLPIGEIGAGRTPAQLGLGQLHDYLTLPWYRHEFAGNTALTGFSDTERIRFAVMQSAALKLAQIVQTEGTSIGTAPAKNAWEVRPRTPPRRLFDSSSNRVQSIALEVLRSMGTPPASRPGEAVPTGPTWLLARNYIAGGSGLGGSYLPDCRINNQLAALFEYRMPETIPAAFSNAFWDSHESFW